MCIPGEAHPHSSCASLGMHILTGNGDVLHREGDVPHRECTFSPRMHILTVNSHSLYKVSNM